jgi:hypothetical protein
MPVENVFDEEWRDCLRAHYKYVVRANDNRTHETLTQVLTHPSINFTEGELRQLYIEATMRAEDFSEDQLRKIVETQAVIEEQFPTAPSSEADRTFQPHPLECQCPSCIQINLIPHDDEGQPLDEDQVAELEEQQKRDQDDLPKQLSLF